MSTPKVLPKSLGLKKGILLAGGTGSRLYPTTLAVNKHLLPVYDKPLIYYPLTTLMLAGVTEILVVSGTKDVHALKAVLGDGKQWGLSITYATQAAPNGIADGILIGADFINGQPFVLILGDTIFIGHGFAPVLRDASQRSKGRATIFTYWVADPSSYGVVQVDANKTPVKLIEKPKTTISHRAIPGLYFYDDRAVRFARSLLPSKRNELEITDLNQIYLEDRTLEVIHLGRGFVWFDAGTTQNLLSAAQLVETLQSRQRMGIAFPEEVAYRTKLISFDDFTSLVQAMPKCAYREYLENLKSEILEGVE